jgi:hypothetical protein
MERTTAARPRAAALARELSPRLDLRLLPHCAIRPVDAADAFAELAGRFLAGD